jgi:hypothetical protein
MDSFAEYDRVTRADGSVSLVSNRTLVRLIDGSAVLTHKYGAAPINADGSQLSSDQAYYLTMSQPVSG